MVFTTKTLFILTLLGNFSAGFGGAWAVSRIAGRIGLVDEPEARSSHNRPTPRGGGAGILVAFLFSGLLLDVPPQFWMPAAGLALFSLGDDFFQITPQVRLCGQFLAAALSIMPVFFNEPVSVSAVVSFSFWMIFLVATANFYNFMDGIDGMAGITGAAAFFLLSFFGMAVKGEFQLSLLAAGLAAACIGFLPFNVPRAKVFLGDVGSILLGFMFALLVFAFVDSVTDFLVSVGFLFPFYADALATLFFRWRNGDRLFQAHRKHLYQVLTNEMGWTHLSVSTIYGAIQLAIGILALVFYIHLPGWIPLFCLLIFLSVVYIFMARCIRVRVS